MSKDLLTSVALTLGISIEQTIHVQYGKYREIFGSFIGNHWGDFSIGVAFGIALAGIYNSVRENPHKNLILGVIGGAIVGLSVTAEVPAVHHCVDILGSPQPPDLIPLASAFLLTAWHQSRPDRGVGTTLPGDTSYGSPQHTYPKHGHIS